MSASDVPVSLKSWFPPVLPVRLATLRVLVGAFGLVYLLAQLPHWWGFAERRARDFQPIGVLSWLDGPFNPTFYRALVILTLIGALLFLIGLWFRLAAPIFAALLTIVLTYTNSGGTITHTDNLWLLHVIVLSLSPAAYALSVDARALATPRSRARTYGWAIRLLCVMCVGVYFVAGIAVLKTAGWAFADGQLLRHEVVVENLVRLELGGSYSSPLTPWLLESSWGFSSLAIAILTLTLGAPLAMAHRYAAMVWATATWIVHVLLWVLFGAPFFYALTFVAFTPFFPVEGLQRALRWR